MIESKREKAMVVARIDRVELLHSFTDPQMAAVLSQELGTFRNRLYLVLRDQRRKRELPLEHSRKVGRTRLWDKRLVREWLLRVLGNERAVSDSLAAGERVDPFGRTRKLGRRRGGRYAIIR
jgi:hypothetical protein